MKKYCALAKALLFHLQKENDFFPSPGKGRPSEVKRNAVYWPSPPPQQKKEPSLLSGFRTGKQPQCGHFINIQWRWKCRQCEETVLLFQEPFWNASDWSRILTILCKSWTRKAQFSWSRGTKQSKHSGLISPAVWGCDNFQRAEQTEAAGWIVNNYAQNTPSNWDSVSPPCRETSTSFYFALDTQAAPMDKNG